MWSKIDWIKEQQQKYNCPVLNAGDLFDSPKPSPELIAETILHLPNKFYTVLGNHELPDHSLKQKHKSGMWVLHNGKHVKLLKGHFGVKNPKGIIIKGRKNFSAACV